MEKMQCKLTSQRIGAPFLTLHNEQTKFQRQLGIPFILTGSKRFRFKKTIYILIVFLYIG